MPFQQAVTPTVHGKVRGYGSFSEVALIVKRQVIVNTDNAQIMIRIFVWFFLRNWERGSRSCGAPAATLPPDWLAD
jgi:hypothetical protein